MFQEGRRKAVDFIIAENAFVADIYVDEGDHWGVQRAAGDLPERYSGSNWTGTGD